MWASKGSPRSLILTVSYTNRHNSGMSTARLRFPRASYENRARNLAGDLGEWVPGLLEYADGPNSPWADYHKRDRARLRARAIQEIVRKLDDISDDIAALW